MKTNNYDPRERSTANSRIMLAPMEGVVDYYMREALTGLGGYQQCVTEFVRVSDALLPERIFYRLCPELYSSGQTTAGTPVFLQLLGSDPQLMAENAARAAELGAPGIDLNFGCPAKCVNNRHGGAVLLKKPEQLFNIIKAVRTAVTANIPVSAKIRLGYDNTDLALENALAVQDAGASFVTVHARTKADGYKAPARWEWLNRINAALSIPVIANGDINSIDEFKRCIESTNCESIMIGRGALACPDLARQIKYFLEGKTHLPMNWNETLLMVINVGNAMRATVDERFIVGRQKQWLAMLKNHYTEAITCFDSIRKITQYSDMTKQLLNYQQTSGLPN